MLPGRFTCIIFLSSAFDVERFVKHEQTGHYDIVRDAKSETGRGQSSRSRQISFLELEIVTIFFCSWNRILLFFINQKAASFYYAFLLSETIEINEMIAK